MSDEQPTNVEIVDADGAGNGEDGWFRLTH